jgi:hypothetical protein
MRRARLSPPEEGAVRELVDAVHAFADDPGPTNLQRYLAVSRELEESRRPRASAAQVAAEPKARTREPPHQATGERGRDKSRCMTAVRTHIHRKEAPR